MLQITDQAVNKVKTLLQAENKGGYGLRVAVKGGGCSGFQYGLTWEKDQQANDNIYDFQGLRVFVDAMSELYVKDIRIDYLDGLQGSGFKIDNPNASGTCGCGSSFSM